MGIDYQETSREAYEYAKRSGRIQKNHHRVMFYMEAHPEGKTSDEIQRALALEHQTGSATVTGLKQKGILRHNGSYRKTVKGRNAQVLRLVRPSEQIQPEIF